jgi:6,7-dimethyl-8-ribityllumazine synthase
MRSLRKSKFKDVKKLKGGYDAKGRRFGIVVSTFNEFLTDQLLEGALDTLIRHGAREKDIFVVQVPGAFEIPLAAKKLIAGRKPDAVITLAIIIRGETKHFDQVAMESAKGVRELSSKSGVPVILGILPANTTEQAMQRAGLKHGNKGREWALSAIEMADISRKLKK